ncbi:MAG: adenylosuccinate synthase [Candidatus Diapherotrites archaeon]
MSLTIIIGAQFGDEGKGKIVDFLSEKADIVVRFNGGDNAGHTVVVGEETYKLHLMPSGAIYGKTCCLASGMAINPKTICEEIELIKKKVGRVSLFIDHRAHVVMPYHILLDGALEEKAGKKIGTTKRGIGPCYADRAARYGIRFSEFVSSKSFSRRLKEVLPVKNIELKAYNQRGFSEKEILKEMKPLAKKLCKYQADVSLYIERSLKAGKNVLFEGAQGFFLDNDFGTYPFVTSSHTSTAGAFLSVGIPQRNCKVIGVTKAYCTRVGSGPFPTELGGTIAKKIRKIGNEYGTTTGRPRRVGWLDLVMLKTAARICGFTELAITKIDVLAALNKIKICTAYRCKGKKFDEVPADPTLLERCKPIYVSFDSFEILNPKNFDDLPEEAQKYIRFVENKTKVPIKIISYGPERKQTILKK